MDLINGRILKKIPNLCVYSNLSRTEGEEMNAIEGEGKTTEA